MKNNWRIYLNGRGYRHFRPFLNWAEKLPEVKKDKKGNKFLFVNDLLKYKGQFVGTNLHNQEKLDITTWFHENVVAFGEATKFLEIIKKEVPEKIWDKYKKYGFCQLWLYDLTKEQKLDFLTRVGLEEWI